MKILVVDDDVTFRTRLVRALVSRGYQAFEAGNATAAVDVTKREKPERAVVDLRMPGPSGLDLITQLTKIAPDIEVIMLTGYGSIPTAVDAVQRGAMNYLTKPCDADEILAAFEKEPEVKGDVPVPSLARVEWEYIQRVLLDCGGNISEAARRLGIHRRSLQRKLMKMQPLE